MQKSKVYFTDFRTKAHGDGLPTKLKKLIRKAGIGELDMEGKFVAIKLHFGELGNISYLRPNYARAVADVVKEFGGKPFLTDCNTMYPGSRKNAIEHLYCAWENGFTPLTVGCPIIIGDGLKGTDDIDVKVEGGEYVESAKIGRAVMDADIFISLNHFKGHEMTVRFDRPTALQIDGEVYSGVTEYTVTTAKAEGRMGASKAAETADKI